MTKCPLSKSSLPSSSISADWTIGWCGFSTSSGYATPQVSKKRTRRHKCILLYTPWDVADNILSSFRLLEHDRKKYATVSDKYNCYFVKTEEHYFERACFNQRQQGVGEPVDDFVMDLYGLAEHCGYGVLHNETIRDRIVVGLRDAKLSERLQMDPDLRRPWQSDSSSKTIRMSQTATTAPQKHSSRGASCWRTWEAVPEPIKREV